MNAGITNAAYHIIDPAETGVGQGRGGLIATSTPRGACTRSATSPCMPPQITLTQPGIPLTVMSANVVVNPADSNEISRATRSPPRFATLLPPKAASWPSLHSSKLSVSSSWTSRHAYTCTQLWIKTSNPSKDTCALLLHNWAALNCLPLQMECLNSSTHYEHMLGKSPHLHNSSTKKH